MTTEESGYVVGYEGEELRSGKKDPRRAQVSSGERDGERGSSQGSSARADKEQIAELETEVGKLKQ